MNSPQKSLFFGLIICLLLGATFTLMGGNLSKFSNSLPSDNVLTDGSSLSIARYYWRIGKIEKAIEEYQHVIPTLPEADRAAAYKELEGLILFDKSIWGRMTGYIAYYAWSLPLKLYILAALLGLILLGVIIYRYRNKAPEFIIQAFYDRTGLDVDKDLPKIAMDRIHELVWRSQNLEGISDLIVDNIEIPTLSLMSEGDNQRAVELLELALLFSLGTTNLPFSQVLSAIKLWLDQPKFLVRGVIDKRGETIILKMLLFDRKNNCVEKIWYIELPLEEPLGSKLIDAVIYPLLYHFNKVKAARWEVLQALHLGLEDFQIFKENQSALAHFEQARQQFERAILMDPGYDLARYNLSLFLLATGEFERARDYLRELSILSSDPQLRLRAKYNHGIALFHLSQDWAYEQAARIFQELLDQNEDKRFEYLVRSALSMTYAKMARRSTKERERIVNETRVQADKLIEELEALSKKNRKSENNIATHQEALANAVASKGFACMALENYEQAIDYFKQSIEIHPKSVSNRLGLGEAYSLMDRKEEALDTFRKTAIQAPLSGYTNYRLGNLYRELGKYEEAIDVLKRAPRYAYARLVLGKVYLEQEEFEKALEEFRQAAQLNGRLSEAWVNIAWAILEMEEQGLIEDPTFMKEALQASRKSLQLEKNDKQRWHRRTIVAFCLHKLKRKELALQEAQEATQLGPRQPQAFYYLALAQYELGQYEQARKSLEKVIELDKKDTWSRKAVELLNKLS